MPELPEVEAIAHFLRKHAVGMGIARIDVSQISVLKTFDPPIDALRERTVSGVQRCGKYLALVCAQPGDSEIFLVFHLARAGWLRWSDALSPAAPKPGRGPIALRIHLSGGGGLDLTEAGTKKNLAVWVTRDLAALHQIERLGTDALEITESELSGKLQGSSARLKTFLTDQTVLSGIGNAYSDEILHLAKLSPFAQANSLSEEAAQNLHTAIYAVLSDAVTRCVGESVARLKGEKRSGLRVHARTGLPCPECGAPVREVAYADRSFQYCAQCQTGGKVLADRRMSRLLK
ncbi:Fpg/Nei family DNA glycosylase [Hoyosella subflava]|uniref:Formamidopyrimidine-DNA glycosylase n=1 Tax=Hoyosella subflava (strain DSM 45089 / JCM 17490 / NBRC 109087 / DQS3-9A1) TaxID=443218 RepID=F6EMC1_HOYSD|nr:DNA-formamidopyrimidine glycosylase family protein [Hoyosella subflava]AEF40281.1 Formamidopyrimidine-DNA glycosylase [Hoyosella subflava DQS3-9A1]